MTKQLTLCLLLIFAVGQMIAQELLTPSHSFSHKKTAYVTLADGTEIQGNIKDIDRKKGLIEFIKLKDGAGKKHKLDAEEVKFMYLPPSGLDKLSKAYGAITDASKWTDEKMDQDLLNQGYIFFELADVKIKKKNRQLLMQLLNPTFSKQVKVYHDPFAKQTMGLGVAGIKVAGGIAKSYYVAKGDKPAFKLQKKNYKKEFMPMWNSCKKIITDYPDMKWSDLTEHVKNYSTCN